MRGTVVTIGAYDGVHLGHQAVIAAVRRPRGRRRAWRARWSPSTATRPRWCGRSRRPACSPTSTRSSSCSRPPGIDRVPGDHLRRGPLEGAGRGVRAGGARRLPRRQGRDRGGGLPLRPPAQGQRRAARGDGRGPRLRGRGPRARRRRRRGGRRCAEGQLHRHPARARGGRPRRRQRAARPSPRGARAWWPTATSGAGSSGSPPPTCRCPATSSCRPTASTPAGTSGPTAPCTPAAISLGRRPTFYEDAHASLLEAHLLDFDGDLYGEHAKVRFVARLRAR